MAKGTPPISDEDLLETLANSAKPIDFADLIAKGIIEADGNWYLVPDLKKLPRHAEMKISKTRMTKKGLKVQFRPPHRGIVAGITSDLRLAIIHSPLPACTNLH